MVQVKRFKHRNPEQLDENLNGFLRGIPHEDLLDIHYIGTDKAIVIFKDNTDQAARQIKELLHPSNIILKTNTAKVKEDIDPYDMQGLALDENLTGEEALPPVAKKRGRPRKIN